MRSLRDRFGFPHLLAGTLVLVGATILLGVAAKATGSGLGCEANWPRCDAGPFNLFPAHIVSFYEWFHRFVSMFAGFAIIGTAVASIRRANVDRRVTALVVLGMVLTPVQVALGRETVQQYTTNILSLHFWTAILIFTLFVVATILVWAPRLTAGQVTTAFAVGSLTVPAHVGLSLFYLAPTTSYPPRVQIAQYALSLAVVSVAVFVVLVGRRHFEKRGVRSVLALSPLLAYLTVFFGRQSVVGYRLVELTYLGLAAVLTGIFLVGIWLTKSNARS
ncbi:cytochrome c oxidase assembly protein subunit 15 [Halostagnicola kamekurae]|uniref:Cytochrome c oxidase assembly protein subunit 15 n=2 Tax=Halostagnicola kamekurae TaxID=619731 RepID=A0A1I6QA01_9EURY|nr:COX15/CtaA family protein [Halostagnicola kamekurae]SFS49286.1 cytochrome c oxidase assembly protein subunit 15 [Halostagnicola kamekurae]